MTRPTRGASVEEDHKEVDREEGRGAKTTAAKTTAAKKTVAKKAATKKATATRAKRPRRPRRRRRRRGRRGRRADAPSVTVPRRQVHRLRGRSTAAASRTQVRRVAQLAGRARRLRAGRHRRSARRCAPWCSTPRSSMTPLAEVLVMAADRAQHVAQVIEPALASGRDVVCDRYSGSTLAYQGFGRGLRPRRRCVACSTWRPSGLEPDVTILLDCPSRSASARRAARDERRRPLRGRRTRRSSIASARASSSSRRRRHVARASTRRRPLDERRRGSTRRSTTALADDARRRRARSSRASSARSAPVQPRAALAAPSTPICSSVPPGSSKEAAAVGFAAGLVCPNGGCGRVRQLPARAARRAPRRLVRRAHRRGDHRRGDPRPRRRGRCAGPRRACARSSSSTTCTSRCGARRPS